MIELDFLSKVILILFIGLIINLLSKKLRLPSIILLILSGVVLKNIYFNGEPFFQLPHEFLLALIIFLLIIILFNSFSSFSLKRLDTYSEYALKIFLFFILLNLLFLTISAELLFDFKGIILTIILTIILSNTDPTGLLFLFKDKNNRIIEILKYESLISTPLVIVLVIILLNFIKFESYIFKSFIGSFFPFFAELIIGLGTGMILSMLVFKLMKKIYIENISPIILLVFIVFSYILAESLNGNGVLSVAVFGIFFEKVSLKGKKEIKQFHDYLSLLLSNIIFVLVGFILPLNLSANFILKSLLLFFIMLLMRFIAVSLAFSHDNFNFKEKIFMSLNCTKGISVAIIALLLSTYLISEIPETLINIILMFIFYSTALSYLTTYFSKYLIRTKIE